MVGTKLLSHSRNVRNVIQPARLPNDLSEHGDPPWRLFEAILKPFCPKIPPGDWAWWPQFCPVLDQTYIGIVGGPSAFWCKVSKRLKTPKHTCYHRGMSMARGIISNWNGLGCHQTSKSFNIRYFQLYWKCTGADSPRHILRLARKLHAQKSPLRLLDLLPSCAFGDACGCIA